MENSSIVNGWVESYLDALLSTGLSSEYINPDDSDIAQAANIAQADRQVCAKYYVQQILSLDEESIQDAWSKVAKRPSTRGPTERDARLEYLSWRVWNMKRKRNEARLRAQQERDLAISEQDLSEFAGSDESPPALDDEELHKLVGPGRLRTAFSGITDIMTEMSDELTPTTAGPTSPSSPPTSPTLDLLNQAAGHVALVANHLTAERVPKLYCVLISLHGLVRGEKMELGKDADTGGQVKYVVELAKALAQHPAVHRVELMTRLIKDPRVAASYGEPSEQLGQATGQYGGAYIVRLPFGPTDNYLRKEALWPHIPEFAQRAIAHIKGMQQAMAAAGETCELYNVHGHYADAAEAAALISHVLGCDMVATGHSLGRNKLEHLLKSGTVSRAEIEETYAISRRIEAEERGLDGAVMVFTSTQQEVDDQWGLYDGYSTQLEAIVRGRRGRHFPAMTVIPPGLDFSGLKVTCPTAPWPGLQQQHQQHGPGQLSIPPSPKGSCATTGCPTTPTSTRATAMHHCTSVPAPESLGRVSELHHALSSPVASPHHSSHLPTSPRTPSAHHTSLHHSHSTPTTDHHHHHHQQAAIPRRASQVVFGPELVAACLTSEPPIWQEIFKFLRNPHKPVILAMSRPDAKKNITTLVRAYGTSPVLRDLANLVLVMGNRDIISSMAPGSQSVLDQVLKLIDAYDLYGSVAYPKRHRQSDISDIYLLPAATRGVFVNIALQEPFGLTLIEAAAHGVPIVATTHGGPVDIIATLRNGILVEPTDVGQVQEALLKLLTNTQLWDTYSCNGCTNIPAYSWPSHCARYLAAIEGAKHARERERQSLVKATIAGTMMDDTQVEMCRREEESASEYQPTPKGSTTDLLGAAGASISEPLSVLERTASSPALITVLSERTLGSISAPGTPLGQGGNNFFFNSVVEAEPGASLVGCDRMVVLMMDSGSQVRKVAKLLAGGLQRCGVASGEGRTAVVVSSLLNMADTRQALQDAGADLSAVDVLICNSGSEIWYSANGGTTWREDLDFESHIDHCWDKAPLKRVLAQALSQRNLFGASVAAAVAAVASTTAAAPTGCIEQEVVSRMVRVGSLHVKGDGKIGLVKRAGSLGGMAAAALHRVASGILPREDRPKIRVFPDTGPHHILVTMTKQQQPAAAVVSEVVDAAPAKGKGKADQRKPPVAPSSSKKLPVKPSAFASAAAQLVPAGADAALGLPAGTSAVLAAAGGASRTSSGGMFDAFADVPALVNRLKRKFRSCGLRVNITAQLDTSSSSSSSSGEQLKLHLTPLRASRALATCFLAVKLQVPFEQVQVVGLPGGGVKSGWASFVASDAGEWVAGVQQVVLLEQGGAAGRFVVDAGVYDGRVRVVGGQ